MSENKIHKPAKTKAQFIADNLAAYNKNYGFLPIQQIKGKLEEDWKKLYGPKRAKPIYKVIKESAIPKQAPKVMVKPEILITPAPTEQLKPNAIADKGIKSKVKDNEIENGAYGNAGDTNNHVDDHDNLKPTKRRPVKVASSRVLRSTKNKLETTIELLSEDNKSVGFIESRGTAAYLKLHNGKIIPWSHSTPIRTTRTNTHLKEITRLPFSPI